MNHYEDHQSHKRNQDDPRFIDKRISARKLLLSEMIILEAVKLRSKIKI